MGSKWEDICPYCGARYSKFRTGLTFAQVREMLFVYSDDPVDWGYKRRHIVLGKWCQIKQEMWQEHLECCKLMDEQQLNATDSAT